MARLVLRNQYNDTEQNYINNYDFVRSLRYATCGYDGILKNIGTECSLQAIGNTIKINSGVIVFQGYCVEIGTNGDILTIDNVTDRRYNTLYLEIDLRISNNQKAEFKIVYDLSTYPQIDVGDDLSNNTSGIARFKIATFLTQNGIISSLNKNITILEYDKLDDYIIYDDDGNVIKRIKFTDAFNEIQQNFDKTNSDITNIKGRLDSLGFKQGTVNANYGTVTNNIKKQAKYAILNFELTNLSHRGRIAGTIPIDFRPKSEVKAYARYLKPVTGLPLQVDYKEITLKTNGEIDTGIDTVYYSFKIQNTGYEIN